MDEEMKPLKQSVNSKMELLEVITEVIIFTAAYALDISNIY